MAKITAYLHLRVRYTEQANGKYRIQACSVDRLTQNPPNEATMPVVKLSLEIPDEMLVPIEVMAATPEIALGEGLKAVLEVLDQT